MGAGILVQIPTAHWPAFSVAANRHGLTRRCIPLLLRDRSLLFAVPQPCVAARPELTDRVLESRERVGITGHSLKGGDPAAPSGTATLLRLHPPHRAHLRHLRPLRVRPATSGAPDSGGVTGGVYKAREHIHRSVLTCGY